MPNKLSNEFIGETLAKELENSGFQINLVIEHGRPWFVASLGNKEFGRKNVNLLGVLSIICDDIYGYTLYPTDEIATLEAKNKELQEQIDIFSRYTEVKGD